MSLERNPSEYYERIIRKWKSSDIVFGDCWDYEFSYPHLRIKWRYWTHKHKELRGTNLDVNIETELDEQLLTSTKYMYKGIQNALFEIIARRDNARK